MRSRGLAAFLLLLKETSALQCHQCTINLDATGHPIQQINLPSPLDDSTDNCWSLETDDFVKDCQDDEDVCILHIDAEWMSDGRQFYKIERTCGNQEKLETETGLQWEGTSICKTSDGAQLSKDCYHLCSEEKCNSKELETDMAENIATNTVDKCEACSGDECLNDLAVMSMDCPFYADLACVNTRTTDLMGAAGGLVISSTKGCSAFDIEDECHTITTIDSLTGQHILKNCRSTCQDDDCNEGAPLALVACYVCEYHQDHTGKILGASDPNCFDSRPSDESIVMCKSGEQCMVDMEIDWRRDGYQEVVLKRSCSKTSLPGNGCLGNSETFPVPEEIYRDCNSLCTGDLCNDYNHFKQVALKHSKGEPEGSLSCKTCSYHEKRDSTVEGNEDCKNKAENVMSKMCPIYADHGCFSAGAWEIGPNIELEDDHRGCSSFHYENLGGAIDDCKTSSGSNSDFTSCKHLCEGSDCNTKVLAKKMQCHTCTSLRDSQGNPIGLGDSNCWENGALTPLLECEYEDSVCVTDITAEWTARGQQLAQIVRGCKRDGFQKEGCAEVNLGDAQSKDCLLSCKESGCNTQYNEVADMFNPDGSSVSSCHGCSYVESDNGDVNGNTQCVDKPDNILEGTVTCPAYANVACYVGANIHVSGDSSVNEEVYRGCSSFKIESDEAECMEENLSGSTGELHAYGVCKETCSFVNCNRDDHPQPELPIEGSYPLCNVCYVAFDQYNRTIGPGDVDCIEGGSKFNELCPNKNDVCLTEMQIDWESRGQVTHTVSRSCSSKPAGQNCLKGDSTMVQYKDCSVSCDPLIDGSGCNSGLEEVSDKFESGIVSKCHACEYYERLDGTVEGLPTCANEIGPGSSTPSVTCPRYSTASCFHATSWHDDYENDGEFEDDYRGCLPFEKISDNRPYCFESNFGGYYHKNCREVCQTDNCNKKKIIKTNRCYVCRGQRNSLNETVGTSDANCFDDPKESMIEDCAQDEDYCIDEMLIDWLPKGEQMMTIKRACSNKPSTGPCDEGSLNGAKYKDCYNSCFPNYDDEKPCNNDMSIAIKFTYGHDTRVDSCFACRHVEHEDGTVDGNTQCVENPPTQDCPIYASIGCYTGAAAHNLEDYSNVINEVYKGCSSFLAIDGEESYDQTLINEQGNPTSYKSTKTSCTINNCNHIHLEPEQPDRPSDPEPVGNMCQVCSVVVDQYERQVGVGQIGCWQGDAAFEIDCGNAGYCSVDLEVDWLPRGNHQYRLVRGCKNNAAPTNCFSNQNSLVMYKDCQVTCEIEKEGNGCNDGLLEVSKKFSVGKVQNCHRCEYFEDENGIAQGTPGCRDKIDSSNQIPIATCPMYADASCHYAGSYHEDYVDSDSTFEDDFRGCSPFEVEERCTTSSIAGLTHLNCKGTCDSNLCNKEKISRHLQCHQCTATIDQEGKVIGSGDNRCFDPQLSSQNNLFLEDCPGGTTHCAAEMNVDWFAKGSQVYTIVRGCYNEDNELPRLNDCSESMTSRFLFKDCLHLCDDDGCNDDDKIYDHFQDEDGFLQTSCYACSYQEFDNGDVIGNVNCGGTPDDDKRRSCPKWATKACMTGTAVHNFEGQPKEEIHKGCSAFDLGGPLYSRDTIGTITFDLIKETCRDAPMCNTNHLLPAENSCYTCSSRKDHLGNDFGFSDGSCWDEPNIDTLLPCANENDVCLTTMTIEWLPKGEQLISLNRACGSPVTAGGQECVEESSDLLQVKTCTDICTSSMCNDNLKVGNLFDQGNADLECYSCQYGRWPDGSILPGSNINCQQASADENVPTRKCPVYLNGGCFQATTVHFDGDTRIEENFRGCSAFAFDDEEQVCNDYTQDTTYTNCRKTCQDDKCNLEKSEAKFSCYTCSETIDAEGNQLGVGNDAGCFSDNPSTAYIQECADGELFCSTDLEADWFYRGSQTWRVRRGCSKTPASVACSTFESGDKLMHFKDCDSTCTASNCNQDLHDVVEKHDTGNRKAACYACSYIETESGDVLGNKNCLDDADKVAGSEQSCPAYANAGCFVGSNIHLTGSGNPAEQVYKGCSSFVIDGPICASNPDFDVGGEKINMAVCKEFCSGNLCNKEHIRPNLEENEYNQCYHCSLQMDHLGNPLGVSSAACMDNPQYSTVCYDGQVCQTQLTVEWFPRGEQITKLERRCADMIPSAGHNPCFESSGQGSKLKQCTDQCDESLCNNDNSVVIDGFDQGENGVKSCIGCLYGKFPDGSLVPNSNKNCMLPEINDSKLEHDCPAYLNAACFTAATWHFDPAGGETEEDFKGCSAFVLEEEEKGCSILDVNGEPHTACRETCNEDNCNNKTPTRRLSCYQCEVVVDSLNNTIGFGQESCWSEDPDRRLLQECPNNLLGGEAQYCVTDIEADWFTTGQQQWRVKRRCSATPTPEQCIQQTDGNIHMKDCATSCNEDGCNSGLYETAAKFDTNLPTRQCYHCEFWEQDNGNVEGNVNCPDQPGLIENAAKDCPIYANAGCYTGTNAHYNSEGAIKEHVYKGCSTFSIPETTCNVIKDVTIDGVQADYGYCQESCFGNLCNEFHEHPTIDRRECFSCRITKDHMGNTIGQGDESCWNIPNGDQKQLCEENQVCLTEMTVDWMPKGEQLVILERKCGVEPFYPGFLPCITEQDDLFWSKTCHTVCDEDDCNDNRDVENEFDQGNSDLQCYSCTYGEWYNGDSLPNSNIYCQNMSPIESVPKQNCPVYANAACFTAATWHFAPNGDEYEEDFRGCSAFSLEGVDYCGAYVNNGITHNSCRSTCDNDLCNQEISKKRLACYTCTVTVDQNNNTIGSGIMDCLSEEPSSSLIEECNSQQSYCTVDIEADWMPLGSMQWTVRRGCSVNPAPEGCVEFADDGIFFKDCSTSCEENDCNRGLVETARKFGNENVDSCYSCTYKENNDGSVSGNKLCADEPDQIGDGTKCPLYAKAACYTASNAHYAPGNVLAEEVYKGCSSFITNHKCQTIEGIIVDGVESDIGICRETCNEDNCNLAHEIAPIDRTTCYVCQITKDFLGNTIGQGDESCWSSPSERNLQQCNLDEICITEMIVDWMPKGEQLVTLNRRCGPEPALAGFDPCGEDWIGDTYAAKSCVDFCEDSKCNNDRKVENLFDQRTDQDEPLSCFSCMYGTFYNGVTLPNSNKYCQMPVSDESVVPTMNCPVYANAGCFTAATWHYMPNGAEYEEDFKGCSTFTTHQDNELLCGEYIVNGITYSNCRSTCHGDNCNAVTPSKKLSCYTCDVTIDINGDVMGYGDARCASDTPALDSAQTCSEEETYCRTVMEADWLSDGHQQYRIVRGCSAQPEWETCPEFASGDSQFLIKDCDSTCNSTLCNDELDSVTSQFSTGSDLSCYVCTYREEDDGEVEGNVNCGSDEVPDQFKKRCPVYADSACFTGTNAHFTSSDVLVEQVYKGCSSFPYDEQGATCSYIDDVIIEGNVSTVYGVCKEACSEDFCNVNHITPDVPIKASAMLTVVSFISIFIQLL